MPITWKNVNAPSDKAANALLVNSSDQLNKGANIFQDLLAENQATEDANYVNQGVNNTAAYRDKVASYGSAEELQAAQASGELSAFGKSFGNNIDRSVVRDGGNQQLDTLNKREDSSRNRLEAGFKRASAPVIDGGNALGANKDFDAWQSHIDENESTLRASGQYGERVQALADAQQTDKDDKYKLKQRGLKDKDAVLKREAEAAALEDTSINDASKSARDKIEAARIRKDFVEVARLTELHKGAIDAADEEGITAKNTQAAIKGNEQDISNGIIDQVKALQGAGRNADALALLRKEESALSKSNDYGAAIENNTAATLAFSKSQREKKVRLRNEATTDAEHATVEPVQEIEFQMEQGNWPEVERLQKLHHNVLMKGNKGAIIAANAKQGEKESQTTARMDLLAENTREAEKHFDTVLNSGNTDFIDARLQFQELTRGIPTPAKEALANKLEASFNNLSGLSKKQKEGQITLQRTEGTRLAEELSNLDYTWAQKQETLKLNQSQTFDTDIGMEGVQANLTAREIDGGTIDTLLSAVDLTMKELIPADAIGAYSDYKYAIMDKVAGSVPTDFDWLSGNELWTGLLSTGDKKSVLMEHAKRVVQDLVRSEDKRTELATARGVYEQARVDAQRRSDEVLSTAADRARIYATVGKDGLANVDAKAEDAKFQSGENFLQRTLDKEGRKQADDAAAAEVRKTNAAAAKVKTSSTVEDNTRPAAERVKSLPKPPKRLPTGTVQEIKAFKAQGNPGKAQRAEYKAVVELLKKSEYDPASGGAEGRVLERQVIAQKQIVAKANKRYAAYIKKYSKAK